MMLTVLSFIRFALFLLLFVHLPVNHCMYLQEGLAVASIARDVVEMTPPRDDNAW